jgi:hypothetical protein
LHRERVCLKPTPALLVASLALALSIGGGVGYAAGSLPHNSVGAKQLKKNAVTGKAIKDGAVTGGKIADGSVTGPDLAAGSVNGANVVPNSLGGAQIDESTLAIPPKPTSLILTGTDFVPRNSAYQFSTAGAGDLSTPSDGTSFAATLHIPQGATITGIRLFYLDNGPEDIEAFVGRFVPATGDQVYSVGIDSEGTSALVRTMTLTPLALPAGSVEDLTIYPPAGAVYKIYGAQVDYQ